MNYVTCRKNSFFEIVNYILLAGYCMHVTYLNLVISSTYNIHINIRRCYVPGRTEGTENRVDTRKSLPMHYNFF